MDVNAKEQKREDKKNCSTAEETKPVCTVVKIELSSKLDLIQMTPLIVEL